MINLETVIGQDKMILNLLLDKLMDQILPKYQKLKDSKTGFDFGGARLMKICFILSRFIDALGELFSDDYEKILKFKKKYEIIELQEAMLKWSSDRKEEVLRFLFTAFGGINRDNLK